MATRDQEGELERLARHRKTLQRYREILLALGMPQHRIEALLRFAASPPEDAISTLDDYHRACRLRQDMAKRVPRGDFLSPAALRLYVIGGEIEHFQVIYEREHGCMPPEIGSA